MTDYTIALELRVQYYRCLNWNYSKASYSISISQFVRILRPKNIYEVAVRNSNGCKLYSNLYLAYVCSLSLSKLQTTNYSLQR